MADQNIHTLICEPPNQRVQRTHSRVTSVLKSSTGRATRRAVTRGVGQLEMNGHGATVFLHQPRQRYRLAYSSRRSSLRG